MCGECMYKAQEGTVVPVYVIESHPASIIWIRCEDQPAPPRDILVWGKCGIPHVGVWDYGDHCHTECCHGTYHSGGCPIEFTHWSELPVRPL